MTVILYRIISTVFRVYYILILVRVLMSWINLGNNVFTRFVYEVTEPFLGIFRRLIQPRLNIPLDFSPVIAFFVLELIENILLRIIIAL